MDMSMFVPSDVYTLNLEAIQDNDDYPNFIKKLARRIKTNPSMSLEYFFKMFLTPNDLEALSELCNTVHDKMENSQHKDEIIEEYGQLLILSMLLANAEGTMPLLLDDDYDQQSELAGYVNSMMVFTTIASLEFKGFVEVNWQNVTFDSSAKDLPLVKLRKSLT